MSLKCTEGMKRAETFKWIFYNTMYAHTVYSRLKIINWSKRAIDILKVIYLTDFNITSYILVEKFVTDRPMEDILKIWKAYGEWFYILVKIKTKSVAYSSQGSHNDQVDFCNWLADGSTTGFLYTGIMF